MTIEFRNQGAGVNIEIVQKQLKAIDVSKFKFIEITARSPKNVPVGFALRPITSTDQHWVFGERFPPKEATMREVPMIYRYYRHEGGDNGRRLAVLDNSWTTFRIPLAKNYYGLFPHEGNHATHTKRIK